MENGGQKIKVRHVDEEFVNSLFIEPGDMIFPTFLEVLKHPFFWDWTKRDEWV